MLKKYTCKTQEQKKKRKKTTSHLYTREMRMKNQTIGFYVAATGIRLKAAALSQSWLTYIFQYQHHHTVCDCVMCIDRCLVLLFLSVAMIANWCGLARPYILANIKTTKNTHKRLLWLWPTWIYWMSTKIYSIFACTTICIFRFGFCVC